MSNLKYTPECIKKLEEFKFWHEEMEKCKNPYYFWKNYIQYKGKPDLTENEYHKQIHDRKAQTKKKNFNYPVSIEECFFKPKKS